MRNEHELFVGDIVTRGVGAFAYEIAEIKQPGFPTDASLFSYYRKSGQAGDLLCIGFEGANTEKVARVFHPKDVRLFEDVYFPPQKLNKPKLT